MSTKAGILGLGDKAHQNHNNSKEQSGKSKLKLSITATHDNQKDASAKDKDKDKEAAGDDKNQQQTNEEKFKQFEDEGVVFKAKLIGSELVMEPRGDKMCQNSIQRLKAIIKGQKAHKKRIVMKISYNGVKVFDEKTNELLYQHEVPQISFISSDDTDTRTFGYVCDVPNKTHQFICFKTSGPAIQVMSVISSLFEAVLDKKKKDEEKSQNQESGTTSNSNASNNNNASTTNNNNNNNIFDTDDELGQNFSQLIMDEKSSSSPAIEAAISTSLQQQQQPPVIAAAATTTNAAATTTIPSRAAATTNPAALTKQKSLGSTLSFSSPMDLIDGSDSGIIDSSSTTFNDCWLPGPPPPPPPQSQPIAQSSQRQHKQQQQFFDQQQVSASFDCPNLLPLNSSSPVTRASTQQGSASPFSSPNLNRLPGTRHRSLIYNHSSVSLNDAALSTSQSSPMSPTDTGAGSRNVERTDKYAVFNDIDNLPSIFESTSSLGSKTNLTNVDQAASSSTANFMNMPMGASAATITPGGGFIFGDTGTGTGPGNMAQSVGKSSLTGGNLSGTFSFGSLSNNQQQANALFTSSSPSTLSPSAHGQPPVMGTGQVFGLDQQQSQNHHHHHHQPQLLQQQQSFDRPTRTPSMMVPINQATLSSSAPFNAGGMVFGSAPMNAHQMSAHARFSSSMVAGLHQRLGSSAASIQSVGSASGLSRQTNPFDDDFFS